MVVVELPEVIEAFPVVTTPPVGAANRSVVPEKKALMAKTTLPFERIRKALL